MSFFNNKNFQQKNDETLTTEIETIVEDINNLKNNVNHITNSLMNPITDSEIQNIIINALEKK